MIEKKLSQAKFKVRNDAATIYTKLYVHNMYTVTDVLHIVFFLIFGIFTYICSRDECLGRSNTTSLKQHRYIGPRLETSQYSKKRIPVILWKK